MGNHTKKNKKHNYTINKRNTKLKKRFTMKSKKGKREMYRKIYGGDRNIELQELYNKKQLFRQYLRDKISQITNKNNSSKVKKEGLNDLITLFSDPKNPINTLIPVNNQGHQVIKQVGNSNKNVNIVDFVPPFIILFDNLTRIIRKQDFINLLTGYHNAGGNLYLKSNKTKETVFGHELKKNRMENVELLLDPSLPFHIKLELVDEPTRNLYRDMFLLKMDEPLPQDEINGYNVNDEPSFWKPLFNKPNELMGLREKIMNIYNKDKFEESKGKYQIEICNILESIVPSYMTKYTLDYKEIPMNLMNTNILNCFITIIYGLLSYKLRETNQKYKFIFKGGRALQIALKENEDVSKYYSEDADILIIPRENSEYNLAEMENLSCHIGYLIKWLLPETITGIKIVISLPKMSDRDITKLLYNNGKYFKALTDIGFGKLSKESEKYFSDFVSYKTTIPVIDYDALFITPSLENMLMEKIFYYLKYLSIKNKLERNEPVERGYEGMTVEESERLLYKFARSIYKLLETIVRKEIQDNTLNKKELRELYKDFLREKLYFFQDYQTHEREIMIQKLFP